MEAPLVRRFPFVGGLSPAGLATLRTLPVTRLPPRRQVLRRGEPAGGAYLVLSGVLRVHYVGADGREATLYRVESGQTCVLALSATFSDAPYPAWVQAGGSVVEVVRVPPPTFRALLEREPAFRDYVLSAMSARIFELMATLEELASSQVDQRLARHLLRVARGPERVVETTQADLASELGTAREVVFRALRGLSTRRLVENGRGRIRLLDVAGLRAVAERPTGRRGAVLPA